MTNQTHFKYKNWWIYSEFGRDCYTAWGSTIKIPSMFGWYDYSKDIYFQFGGTRKDAIDKLIDELNDI